MHAAPAPARMQQLARRLARSPAKSLLSTRSLLQARAAAASAVQWLEQVTQQPSTEASSDTINLSRSCIRQADSLAQQARSRLASAGSSDSSMSTLSTSTEAAAATAPASTIVLQEQQVHIPAGFAAPPKTSVPVHQLVAIFSSFLGSPVLHKDARVSTMEAKWRLLQLLLLRHARQEAQLAEALDSLLQFALRVSAKKLSKVRKRNFFRCVLNSQDCR